VSMDYGPVLSKVKDLITMETESEVDGEVWREYVTEPERYRVRSRKSDPEVSELSDYELSILEQIDEAFGKWDRFYLSKWTHRLPEWTDPHKSSLPIDPEVILRHTGKSSEEIASIADDAEQSAFMRQILVAP